MYSNTFSLLGKGFLSMILTVVVISSIKTSKSFIPLKALVIPFNISCKKSIKTIVPSFGSF
jgi:hypothetical protein